MRQLAPDMPNADYIWIAACLSVAILQLFGYVTLPAWEPWLYTSSEENYVRGYADSHWLLYQQLR